MRQARRIKEREKHLVYSKFSSGSPIRLSDPWGPLLICKMSRAKGPVLHSGLFLPLHHICVRQETQSGGQGKDTQLGKVESGLTSLAERPFSFGQAQRLCSSALSPAERRSLLPPRLSRTDLSGLGGGNRLYFQLFWSHSHWLKFGYWKLSTQLAY